MAECEKLGSPRPLGVNKAATGTERSEMEIDINGITLSEALFDGKFFQDRRITISGKSLREGYIVKGWKVTTIDSKYNESTETVEGSSYSFLMPSCKSLAIEAIVDTDTGINQVLSDDTPADYYNLKGVSINTSQHPEVVISRHGKSSRKILRR